MGRPVRLYDYEEKTYGDKDNAWKAPNGKYYSSEEAYENIQTANSYLQKCKDKMFDLMGYKEGMLIPRNFYCKLSEWKKIGYDVVYDTMCGKEDDIYWATIKTFKNESSKAAYICAIIENNLMDYYKKKQNRNTVVKESEVITDDDLELHNGIQSTKDISRFLEDED